jgi:hypothetical protein
MRLLAHVVDHAGMFGAPKLGTLLCFGSLSGGGKTADVTVPPPEAPPDTDAQGTVLVMMSSLRRRPE